MPRSVVFCILFLVLFMSLCLACAPSSGTSIRETGEPASATPGGETEGQASPAPNGASAPKLTVDGRWKAAKGVVSAIAGGSIASSDYLAVGMGLDTGQRLVMLELSDSVMPVETGGIDSPSEASGMPIEDLAFSGTRIFATLAGPGGGLWIVDVSNPSSPQHVAFLRLEGSILGGLAVADDSVFMVGDPGREFRTEDSPPGKPAMLVLDVSDPQNPSVRGSLGGSTWGSRARVVTEPPVAYLVGPTGLHLIDIGDPSEPQEIGSLMDPDSAPIRYVDDDMGVAGYRPSESSPRSIAIQGGYAYVASGSNGLSIVDVSTSASPSDAGSIFTGFTQEVAALEHLVFVHDFQDLPQTGTGSAIRMIDVSDPGSPRLLASLDTQEEVAPEI